MPDPTDPAPPSSLTWVGRAVAGRYEIRTQIAQGAMGRVFLAVQQPLGREVAVKVLETHDDLDEYGQYEARFVKEAAALARLSHPNTVRIIDYGSWEGRLYLVMEFVDGRTLRDILKEEGRLAPERAIALAKQIAGSLAESHEQGIVHRDLKPSNVLVTRSGRQEVAKVVDFGLVKDAHAKGDPTAAGLMLGTPRYMSPEQIRGEPVDGRADLYALGVLLYRSLTGRVPFAQRSTITLLHSQLSDAPPPFSDAAPELHVPPALEWVVRTCLEKRREDRFADAWELISALEACQLILRDRTWRDAELRLEEGKLVAPFTLTRSDGLLAGPEAPGRGIGLVPLAMIGGAVALVLLVLGIAAVVLGITGWLGVAQLG